MKVQRKEIYPGRGQYDVLEESPSFFIVTTGGEHQLLPKEDYEPVQEWVDVTHECRVEWTGGPTHEVYHKGNYVSLNNYRITRHCLKDIKVEVKR